jgi:hypothetical protein
MSRIMRHTLQQRPAVARIRTFAQGCSTTRQRPPTPGVADLCRRGVTTHATLARANGYVLLDLNQPPAIDTAPTSPAVGNRVHRRRRLLADVIEAGHRPTTLT